MEEKINIHYLKDKRCCIPTLERYYKSEWGEYYGSGGLGNAKNDAVVLCNKGKLPIGLIAKFGRNFSGSIALREKSASHKHLGPWVTSFFIVPEFRRNGIGTQLVKAIQKVARELGYTTIYTRSATAVEFFKKNNWIPFERISSGKRKLIILKKEI